MVIHVSPFVTPASLGARVLLPTLAWCEESGTVVNFQGRIQAVRRARVPRGEGRPGWRLAADLAEALGLDYPAWTSSEEVLESLARAVPEFGGVDGPTVGLLGVPGRAGSETRV